MFTSYISILFYVDIVDGNLEKIREFLDVLASDEWFIDTDTPQVPIDRFSIETCDLR